MARRGRVRTKHHSRGYAALLKDPKLMADLNNRARRIAAAAGGNTVAASSEPIHTRNRAAVIAPKGDPDNRLIRSLDAGR